MHDALGRSTAIRAALARGEADLARSSHSSGDHGDDYRPAPTSTSAACRFQLRTRSKPDRARAPVQFATWPLPCGPVTSPGSATSPGCVSLGDFPRLGDSPGLATSPAWRLPGLATPRPGDSPAWRLPGLATPPAGYSLCVPATASCSLALAPSSCLSRASERRIPFGPIAVAGGTQPLRVGSRDMPYLPVTRPVGAESCALRPTSPPFISKIRNEESIRLRHASADGRSAVADHRPPIYRLPCRPPIYRPPATGRRQAAGPPATDQGGRSPITVRRGSRGDRCAKNSTKWASQRYTPRTVRPVAVHQAGDDAASPFGGDRSRCFV